MPTVDFEFQTTKRFERKMKKQKDILLNDVFAKSSRIIVSFLKNNRTSSIHKLRANFNIPNYDGAYLPLYSIVFTKELRILCTIDAKNGIVVVTLYDICNHDDYEKSVNYISNLLTSEVYCGKH